MKKVMLVLEIFCKYTLKWVGISSLVSSDEQMVGMGADVLCERSSGTKT